MTGPCSVFDLLAEATRYKEDGPLFSDDVESASAAQVMARADSLARGLQAHGMSKGDRAVFLVGGSVQHAVAFFACMRLGLVPCALHVRMAPSRLAQTTAWLGARLIVADEANLAQAEYVRRHSGVDLAIVLSPMPSQSAGLEWTSVQEVSQTEWEGVLPTNDLDDLAYIILSSGTTGEPKGVMHSHRTALASVAAGKAVFGDAGSKDVVLLAVTPSFAAWINCVLPFTAVGAEIFFQSRFTPTGLIAALEDQPVTYVPLPPTLWRMLMDESRSIKAPSLRYLFFSGEPGSQSLVDDLLETFPLAQLRGAWLSSEAGCGAGIVADDSLLKTPGKANAAGVPVPGARIRFSQPQGELTDYSVAGEIVVESTSVSIGYWGQPEDLDGRLHAGRWRTGDMAALDSEGIIFIHGRIDNVINTGGIKVHAEEVESILLSHPAVLMAAVIGVPDHLWGQTIEGHVTTRGQVTAQEILAHCRSLDVETYKIPKRIVFHEGSLPTTPSGKIYRKGLVPEPVESKAVHQPR